MRKFKPARLGEKSKVRWFLFSITSRCNFACPHCLRGPAGSDDLSLDLYMTLLPKIERLGYTGISFTGGEPALHAAFPQAAREAARRGFRIAFVSNGSLLDRYRFLAEELVGSLEYAGISLDGSTPELHNGLRPPGSYDRVIETIRYFVGKGVYTKILTTLSRANRHDVEQMVELADALGVKSLVYSSLIETPTNGHLILSDAEKRACNEEIGRNARERSRAQVFPCALITPRDRVHFCPDLEGRGLTVNPKGELIFCCDTLGDGAVLGSLEESSLNQLFGRAYLLSRKIKALRRRILKSGNIPPGFDTCDFCNRALAGLIRTAGAPPPPV